MDVESNYLWGGVFIAALGVLSFFLSPTAHAYECLIEPNRSVEIRSPVEGIIAHVVPDIGDAVKEGQLLVELDSTVEKAALEVARYRAEMNGAIAAAKSRLEFARKKVERFENLEGKSFISAQQKDEAQAEARLAESELTGAVEEKELARIEYKRAVAMLEQRLLHSPFDGFVAERNLSPGDLAEPNSNAKAILKLSQLNPLKIVVTLPLEMAGKIKLGEKMSLKAESGQLLEQAVVSAVSSELDAKSGTFQVHLKLPNPDNQIHAGIRCDAFVPSNAPTDISAAAQ